MLEVHFQAVTFTLQSRASGLFIKQVLFANTGINPHDVYLICNGKLVDNDAILCDTSVSAIPKVLGGKGGFGSMLRAIGAQIEKTTNREACRDLSGRRLRDINEEKRLKVWLNQQAEREKEASERKQMQLEKLCEMPKHEFKDENYSKERSELPEKVQDALLQGLKASSTQTGIKRKLPESDSLKKKKTKLWIDADIEDLSTSGSEHENSDEEEAEKLKNTSDECSKSST